MSLPATAPALSIPLGAKPTCHKDGTLTYWSVSQRQMCAKRTQVASADVRALPPTHRYKIGAHLQIHGWRYDAASQTHYLLTGADT
jgi:hypothetical protein